MKLNTFNLNAVALSISIALTLPAIAQEADAGKDSKKEKDYFEQIIVTGTASGTAVRKVDSAYATTSMDADTIKKLAPKSTADLFKAIPGIWAESSGGVSGANVFVRGIPSGGDAPFVTVQLQGVPVYAPPTLSFLENSTLFRLDDTISFMDGLRGGPSSVLSNGQPGLTTNFLLKEGGESTEGSIKYTTSDYDLQRIDGVLSGSLADDLYFMIGGYVQQSPGIRDAGFTSEKGHQFTVNITKVLDNGKLNLFTRVTDDHGEWYLPVPLVDGVDASYNQLGTKNRQATIQYGSDGQSEAFDFGEGRGWDGSVSGGSIQLELADSWTFVDRFGYTKGDADTLGLVPNGNPVALSTVADNGTSAVGVVTGKTYSANTLVQQQGYWVVRKQIEAFSNDMALTKTMDSFKGTVGFFATTFSANDWWSIGNQVFQVVEKGGEVLTGIDCNDNQDSCGWNYDINSTGDGRTKALYVSGEFKLNEQWTVDAGVRQENHVIEYTVDEGLTGHVSKAVQYDENDTAWNVGANWQMERDMGIFVRASHGSKMPYFDDFRDNFGAYQANDDLIKDIDQIEVGFKLAKSNYNLYATVFTNQVDDTFVPQPGATAVDNSGEAKGIEIDAAYFNDNGFSMSLNATVQDTENVGNSANKGKEAFRQPGWQMRLTPSYEFEMGALVANVYGTLTAVDSRWSDPGNTVELDGYEKLDLGLVLMHEDGLKFEFAIQNLTDEDALTEGDPRTVGAENGRFIMPRNASFSVSYEFF
jgi:iron complex outermembrane recepter protein